MKTDNFGNGKLCRALAVLSAGFVVLAATRALAVTLSVSSATAVPGDVVQICVDMASEGQDVAGVQTDLVWSPQCAEIDQGSCQAGAHGKQLHKSLRSNGRLKVLVLSLDNVEPIPDGSRLYCCSFRVRSDAAMTNCPLTLQNVGASDPEGNAITTSPLAGAIRLSGVGGGDRVPEPPTGRVAAPAPGVVAGAGQPQAAEPGAPGASTAAGAAGAPPAVGGIAPVIIATPPAEALAEPQQPVSGEPGAVAEAAPPQAPQAPAPVGESVPAGVPTPAGEAASTGEQVQPAATEQAATAAETKPAAVDTPTSKPTLAPTRPAVKMATPTEKVDESACQVGVAGTRASTCMLVLGVLLLATLRRRSRSS